MLPGTLVVDEVVNLPLATGARSSQSSSVEAKQYNCATYTGDHEIIKIYSFQYNHISLT